MTTKLAHQTQKTAGIPNGMRTGTIAAVSSTGITLTVSGGSFTAGVGVVTSYAPRVGDTVAVFRQDSSWLILGPTSAVNGWQAMADLGYQNGWTDRGGAFPIGQYRVVADEVKLVGQINNASVVSNTIVSGLPPSTGEIIMVAAVGATKVRLGVYATGSLILYDPPSPAVAGTLQFCCSYPLDARLS